MNWVNDSINGGLCHLERHSDLLLLSDSNPVPILTSRVVAWSLIYHFNALISILDKRSISIELPLRITSTTLLIVSNERALLIRAQEILTSTMIQKRGVLDPTQVIFH